MDRTTAGWTASRRRVVGGIIAAAAVGVGAAAHGGRVSGSEAMRRGRQATPEAEEGRLRARPGVPTEDARPGVHRLGLAEGRDALLVVPAGYRPDRPAPLVLSLHGAGGNEEGGLYPLRELADGAGVILLSPASRGRTWDVILGGLGPDVAFVDRALAAVFARCAVDPARLAVAGFSDGASYALSLGIMNGDLFGHVLAFSPGFEAPAGVVGKPRFFVSHGTDDAVLPIDRCSRRIVPRLRDAGYDVDYREFAGGHTVP
ncbi:MAG: hypothetical protein AVDCRST_MAG19-3421, partial [uncultured Thermomicrobiales bacterium]